MNFLQSMIRDERPTLLLMRHGTGDHITGSFSVKRQGSVGPSLTGKFHKRLRRYTGGKGEAVRRCVRQLNNFGIVPTQIWTSPQLRAIETSCFSRLNQTKLRNGKTLRDVPIKIIRSNKFGVFEQTRCLEGQGAIIPSLKEPSKKWPNWSVIRKDKPLLQQVRRKLTENPRDPPRDPNGSALPRAKRFLQYVNSGKFNNNVILLVAHNGICQDIIRAHTNKFTPIFDFCEIRHVDGTSLLEN
tara:strand:+ start:800 stop:1525 length:726 start_codon:yes stop_codon:yes gene_type:complete